MERETLRLLEKVNQLSLDEAKAAQVLNFFEKQEDAMASLNAIDTSEVERMVHVGPTEIFMREDVEKKLFTRDELQQGAPETMDGYWQVPRLVE